MTYEGKSLERYLDKFGITFFDIGLCERLHVVKRRWEQRQVEC